MPAADLEAPFTQSVGPFPLSPRGIPPLAGLQRQQRGDQNDHGHEVFYHFHIFSLFQVSTFHPPRQSAQPQSCRAPAQLFGRHAPRAARVLRALGRQVAREQVFPGVVHSPTFGVLHFLNRSSTFMGASRSSIPSTSSNEDGSPFMSKKYMRPR